MQLLHQMYDESTSEVICKIPFPTLLCWINQFGEETNVDSMLLGIIILLSPQNGLNNWKHSWKVKQPMRIIMFLRKLSLNALPVTDILEKHHCKLINVAHSVIKYHKPWIIYLLNMTFQKPYGLDHFFPIRRCF